jgi:hypothetical protein
MECFPLLPIFETSDARRRIAAMPYNDFVQVVVNYPPHVPDARNLWPMSGSYTL